MNNYEFEPSDHVLVTQVLADNHSAYEPLLLRHYPSLIRLCNRLVGPVAASDIAQEAALAAFLNLPHLREPARFGAWLHAIAANLARMELRQRRVPLISLPDDESRTQGWIASSAPSPEDILIARELHDAIVAALNELSHLNREVVIGFFLDGYRYAELAELLGVPISTVKGRLFKGRQQLRAALAPLARDLLTRQNERKEHMVNSTDLVNVRVEGIRTDMVMHNQLVMLREDNGTRMLPIFIGEFEAQAIALALDGQIPVRPMTHDLALRLIEAAGWEVRKVTINQLAEHTFYAQITLGREETTVEVDARPSDALVLAVRNGAPIYALSAILEETNTAPSAQAPAEAAPVHEDAVAAGEEQPTEVRMLNRVWRALLAFWTEVRGKSPAELDDNQIPEAFPAQLVVIQNQEFMAIELSGGDQPVWLAVSADLKSQLDTRLARMRAQAQHFQTILRTPMAPIPNSPALPPQPSKRDT